MIKYETENWSHLFTGSGYDRLLEYSIRLRGERKQDEKTKRRMGEKARGAG